MTALEKLHPGYDVEAARADFPILSREVYGKPLAFLDTAASAQKPRAVIDRVRVLYETGYANIHRGVYFLSQEATEAYEETRHAIARFINASAAHECLFVRGATEGINLVAQSWGRTALKAGDVILLSELEHHSNIVPWQLLRDQTGIEIKPIPIQDDGSIDLEAYRKLLADNPVKLVAVLHISNAIGTVVPVKEMARLAHDAGARILIDGCQAAPRTRVDVQDLGVDFYAFSGHKLYGPTGIGVLWGREELLDAMPPWQGGGDMIETVTFEKTTYNGLPHKFEAGTPNIAGGIGLKPALDYVSALGLEAIEAHEDALLDYATERLQGLNSLKIIGTAPNKAGIISFTIEGSHPHDVGTILDREGVAVRAGHHCCQPLMARFGVPATARASFGLYNTTDDVDALIRGIKKVLDIFG